MNKLTIDKLTRYIGYREILVVKFSLGHRYVRLYSLFYRVSHTVTSGDNVNEFVPNTS